MPLQANNFSIEDDLSFDNWTGEDFNYSEIHKNDIFKVVSVAFSVVGVLIVTALATVVIWYEKNEFDQNQVFVNKLVVSICWTTIEWCLIIQTAAIARFFTTPFPKSFCFLQLVLRKSVVTQLVLFYDLINVSRYIFIFHLKNPTTIQEDFWCRFLNVWVVTVSTLFHFAWAVIPGRQPLHYSFCSGENPIISYQQNPKPSGHFEIPSLLILSFVQSVDSHTFSSLLTNVACGVAISFEVLLMIMSNKIPWTNVNLFPNVLLLQAWFLVAPIFSALSIASVYFLKQKDLRKTVAREMKNELGW